MTKRVRRSDLCANFATEIEYYLYVIQLFSRERGRFFRLGDIAPALARSGENIVVSWGSLDGNDDPRIVNFVDISDFWTKFYVVMHEAYLETYSPLFAKSRKLN
jgi:hypothetical protein